MICKLSKRLSTFIAVVLLVSVLSVFPHSPTVNAQPTIVEPRFVSPNYNYSITWDSPWFITQNDVEEGIELLSIHDGLSEVRFIASRFGGYDAPALHDDVVNLIRESEDVTEFAAMVDTTGAPMTETNPDFAYSYHAFTILQGISDRVQLVTYIETRILPDGTELVINAQAGGDLFESYAEPWSQLFSWVETTVTADGGVNADSDSNQDAGAVEFIIETGISEQDLFTITEGVHLAEGLFESKLDATIGDTLYITALPIESPQSPDIAGSASGSAIVFYTGSRAWASSITPLERIGTVVHEYTHIYQHWISNGENGRSAAWFEEGLAEYMNAEAMARLSITDKPEIEALFGYRLTASPSFASLAQLESQTEFRVQSADVYALGYFAVTHLLKYSGAGYTDIENYYSQLRDGSTFEAAFQAAFGISTQQFYQDFERVRGSVGGVPALPDDFIILESHRSQSFVSLSVGPTLLATDRQFLFVAETVPGAVCRLRIVVDSDGSALINRSTFANGEGELFWLVTIPADVKPSTGTLSVSCGSLRDQVDILIAR